MNGAPQAFDRPVALADMLRGVPRAALEAAMEHSVGAAWRITAGGAALRAGPVAFDGDSCSAELVVDIETVGTLSVPAARQDWLAGAAKWLELLLGASNRYRMAADLHLETVHADHRELMAKHADLLASEARYRLLSEQLEERVRTQVALIELSQRRMFQSEKMASVGNLAAGMAHEINNPIGFIRSNLSTAKGYVATLAKAVSGAPADARQVAFALEDFDTLLDESIHGADRIGRIIADLKAYAACDVTLLAPADPNDALRSAVRLLGELPDGVALEVDLAPLPVIECNSDGLRRVALALLLNARAAMQGRRGAIRLASAVVAGEIVVTVADQGCGIAPALHERIFEPFFTTRDVGAGIGLGLTVAADVARAHGGRIEVASTPGQGSRFTLRIALAPLA
jgi:two-component system NtrC family sensor kinase